MIVLKILLWILLAVLGIILLILILPVSAKGSYIDGKLSYSVKYSFITVINSEGRGILKLFQKKKKTEDDDFEDISPDDVEIDDEVFENMDKEDSEETAENQNSVNEITEEASVSEEKTEEFHEAAEDTDSEEISEKEEKSDASEKSDDSEEKSDKKKSDGSSKLEFILDLIECADRPLLKIFKGIKLSELYIDFIIANEDAYKCALNYGRICGALYTLLGWLSVLFNVKLKTIDVNPGFALSESRWDASAKISFSLITLVIAGIWFLLIYIFRIYIPSKFKKKQK